MLWCEERRSFGGVFGGRWSSEESGAGEVEAKFADGNGWCGGEAVLAFQAPACDAGGEFAETVPGAVEGEASFAR